MTKESACRNAAVGQAAARVKRMDRIRAAAFLLSIVGAYEPLTGKQFRVLNRMAHHWSLKAIAHDLQISERDVEGFAAEGLQVLKAETVKDAVLLMEGLLWPLDFPQEDCRSITPTLRFRVLDRDGFTCVYCGRRPPEVVLELDHAIPWARGGRTVEDNLVTSCRECNLGKGGRPIGTGGAR